MWENKFYIWSDRLTAADVLNQKWLRRDSQTVQQEDQPIVRRMRRRTRKKLESDIKQVRKKSSESKRTR